MLLSLSATGLGLAGEQRRFSLLPPAGATAKAPTTQRMLEELAAESALVAVVHISETKAFASGPAGRPGIHTAIAMQEVEPLVGAVSDDFWVQGGVLSTRARHIAGQVSFEPGEQALIFLRRASDGTLWPLGRRLAKWPIVSCNGRDCVRHPLDGSALPLADAAALIRQRRDQ